MSQVQPVVPAHPQAETLLDRARWLSRERPTDPAVTRGSHEGERTIT